MDTGTEAQERRMDGLPGFNEDGVLPPGEYALTLDQIERSMLVTGEGVASQGGTWDREWRHALLGNLAILAGQLWEAGIEEVFIDGSFVEDKDHPNDIDGYFVCDPMRLATGELERTLNKLDPSKCWTWDHTRRRRYRGYPKGQLPMWHAYRVELYPHYTGLIAGEDRHGNALEFPAFFRTCRRTDAPKGIVRVLKTEQ